MIKEIKQMQNEDIIKKIGELLFFLGTFLYMSYYSYYVSYFWRVKLLPQTGFKVQQVLCIALVIFGVKILLTIRNYNKFEMLVGILVSIVLYNCWKTSGTIDFLVNFLLIFAMKDVDLKRVMKIAFVIGITFFMYGTSKVFLDNPTLISITKDFGRGVVETRYQFFAWHPNILHLVFSSFIIIFLYIYSEKCKWWGYGITFFFNYELFLLTGSRTGFYTGCVAIAFSLVVRYTNFIFKYKISLLLFETINMIMIFGSMYLAFGADVNSNMYKIINQKLTGRLDVFKIYYAENGIHLFGSDLGGKLDGFGLFNQRVSGSVPELGFPRLILEYGPIIFGIFVVLIIITTIFLYQRDEYDAMIMLSSCIFSFTIDALYPAAWNPIIFVVGYGVFRYIVRSKEKGNDKMENIERC